METDQPLYVAKDRFNQATFKPAQTDTIKIEIGMQKDRDAGVQEGVIE